MFYPIYDYYRPTSLTLKTIFHHYVDNYYLKTHSEEKFEKVKKKAIECEKMKNLYLDSIKNRRKPNNVPTYNDFAEAISGTTWFLFQSNQTVAVAVLAAAEFWDRVFNN